LPELVERQHTTEDPPMIRNDLPPIMLLPDDLSRLDLLTGRLPAYRSATRRMLARELARARVLSSSAPPADLVTMHSTVRYRDDDTERIETATIVYPGECARAMRSSPFGTTTGVRNASAAGARPTIRTLHRTSKHVRRRSLRRMEDLEMSLSRFADLDPASRRVVRRALARDDFAVGFTHARILIFGSASPFLKVPCP
jgi:hypothetical protein